MLAHTGYNEAAANVPPAHFGYMASGVDDEVTLRANREGFLRFQLRRRRLVDVSRVDMSTEILGMKYDTSIIVAPVGGQKAFYTAARSPSKAAKVGNHLQILSTVTTSLVEDITDGIENPVLIEMDAIDEVGARRGRDLRSRTAGRQPSS